MPIRWNEPLQTRHDRPRKAELLDDDGIASRLGKRRVAIQGDFAAKCPPTDPRNTMLTTYLFDENGRCNCSGKDSPFDLVNVADTLAKAA